MDANLILWIGQALVAVAFAGVGYGHAFAYESAASRPTTRWMADVGPDRMRLIGLLEILGAVGVVLPALTGILPWLTPIAAAGLAILMLFAAVFHARRPGEGQNVVINLVLAALALAVALGRFFVAPL